MASPHPSSAPRIPSIMISTSPILPSSPGPNESEIDALVAMLTKRIGTPAPTLAFTPRMPPVMEEPTVPTKPCPLGFIMDPSQPAPVPSPVAVPPLLPTTAQYPTSSYVIKPTPTAAMTSPLPLSTPTASTPSKDVISLLSLLESFEASTAADVARLQAGLRDAHTAVAMARGERQERMREARRRREREKRETKEVGDDFWLGVY